MAKKAPGQAMDIQSHLTYLEMNIATLFRSGIDLQARRIQLIGEIDEDTFAKVDAGLALLEAAGSGKVTLVINSFGGSAFDALAIVGRMKASKCSVETECYGAAMSAATLILASGSKRRMSKYSTFMHHEASYAVRGRAGEIQNEVARRELEDIQWDNYMGDVTNKPADFWTENRRKGRDFYLSAEKCLEYGIVDQLI